eukprot:g19644.t1
MWSICGQCHRISVQRTISLAVWAIPLCSAENAKHNRNHSASLSALVPDAGKLLDRHGSIAIAACRRHSFGAAGRVWGRVYCEQPVLQV